MEFARKTKKKREARMCAAKIFITRVLHRRNNDVSSIQVSA